MNDFRTWPKGARRGPARVNVGKIESVELRPKNVALRTESGVSLLLIFASARMLDDPAKSKFGVLGSLR